MRFRSLAPLLAAVAVGCAEDGRPDDAARTAPSEPPAAAVRDRGAPSPRPGDYAGRTTQGRDARLQVLPGGRVHFVIPGRLRCGRRPGNVVRSFPNRLPVLLPDGRFTYRESGRGRGFAYRLRARGHVGPYVASGSFTGTARYSDGRRCRTRVFWSTGRAAAASD